MSNPTPEQLNAMTDRVFFLTYTGGVPVKLAVNDPRAHDWWLTRHFVRQYYDAFDRDFDDAVSSYVTSVWLPPASTGEAAARRIPASTLALEVGPGTVAPHVAVRGAPAPTGLTNDDLRRAALNDVMRRRVDFPHERMWLAAFEQERDAITPLTPPSPVISVAQAAGVVDALARKLALRYWAVFGLDGAGAMSLLREGVYNPGMTDDGNATGIISGHRGYRGGFRLPYRDRLAYIAPIVYPASAGAGIDFQLDGNVLRASICVDGRCYDGEVDLSQILAARGATSVNEPADPSNAQMAALEIKAAGDALVGQLLEQHAGVMIGGWWDSITHAVSSAAGSVAGAAVSTLRLLKTPIKAAAQMAAPQLVAAIPGVGPALAPIAGPMAGKLTGNLIDSALGDDNAKQAVAQAQQAAQTDPIVAAALSAAQKATGQSTAAYHGAQTAANAASGNVDAQAQLAELHHAAKGGDLSADNLLGMLGNMIPNVFAPPGTPNWSMNMASVSGDPTYGPSGSDGSVDPADPTAVSMGAPGVAGMGRQAASALAVAEHARSGAAAIGVVFQGNGAHIALPLESLDAADDWLGKLSGGTFAYAAYYDATDPTWPAPINERVGAKVVSSGWLAPVLAAAGGFGLGAVGWPWVRDHAAAFLPHGAAPPAGAQPPVKGWTDYIPGVAAVRAVEDVIEGHPHHHRHHHRGARHHRR